MSLVHIVIDARLYGPRHTGLGRYTKNLLIALSQLSTFAKYRFTLIIYPELKSEIKKDLGTKFELYSTKIRHYSLANQLILPFILWSLHPHLVHFTYLDKPILYLGKSVVTVHDLIKHFSRGPSTTTHTSWLYWPKYWGYLLMSWFIIRFNHIIVPSIYWRNFIIDKYKINPKKIVTTYEAVDNNFRIIHKSYIVNPKSYLLYTGNLYPHKNIIVLFQALQQLPHLKLKIICSRDIFQARVSQLARKLNISSQIEFLGYLKDNQFSKIYSQAIALVHPSILEGFSLTGLEAMSLDCPVIAANSSCLPEIYGQSVLYFDPHDPQELVRQIIKLQNSRRLRHKLINLGHLQIKKYSWTNTAVQTLNFYEQTLG
ncbi:MAG: glycosyltransferase family 1 protein [Microgenomates group bacterium]